MGSETDAAGLAHAGSTAPVKLDGCELRPEQGSADAPDHRPPPPPTRLDSFIRPHCPQPTAQRPVVDSRFM